MKIQIQGGKNTERLMDYFAKHGYNIKLSKAKRHNGYRHVKFKYQTEKLFFVLTYGEFGTEFIEEFSIKTGIQCSTGEGWI